jgi:hypothetical protein
VPRPNFIGSDLSDFIPPPLQHDHHRIMLRFAVNCKSTEIELPFDVFIYKDSI